MLAQNAILALEDGTVFKGKAIGAVGSAKNIVLGEVVFNTAMTGYQEILSDPSYSNQLITLTYPHIGNVGVNNEDLESKRIYAKGLIIRELPILASSWRKQHSLEEFLKAQNVLGISQIDTRKLTKTIRKKGALKGCIFTDRQITDAHIEKAIQKAKSFPSMQGRDLAKVVSTELGYTWQGGGTWCLPNEKKQSPLKSLSLVVYDFGVKHSILRMFDDLGFKMRIVPATTPVEEVLSLNPDGVFLSNGPGDPEPCTYAIEAAQKLFALKVPIFGICLGFQIMALALGAKTFKMKFGHHGGNHPVKSLEDNRVLITSQNHGFAVDEATLPKDVIITHRSLFDDTIQGFKHKTLPIFGFQGHPEAGPGPNDAKKLFNHFITMLKTVPVKQKAALLET